MFARTYSAAVVGVNAVRVEVEADCSGSGMNGLELVGLPDNAVKESRQRIRSAFENSRMRMTQRTVVVNLAPADLRKEGASFDLPIAVSVLAVTQQIPADMLAATMFAGELSLDGTV